MLEKIISTLTLSILKSIYTLISSIMFYKLYFIVTLGYSQNLLLENYIYIVILTPDL